MTAKEWIKKFGVHWSDDEGDIVNKDGDFVKMMDSNLEDMACECGAREEFRIEVSVVADVNDCDINPDKPDYSSFNNESYCRCCSCQENGDVSDFKIKGLDKLLYEIYDEEIKEPNFDPDPTPVIIIEHSANPEVEKAAKEIIDKILAEQQEKAQTIGWDTSNIKP